MLKTSQITNLQQFLFFFQYKKYGGKITYRQGLGGSWKTPERLLARNALGAKKNGAFALYTLIINPISFWNEFFF